MAERPVFVPSFLGTQFVQEVTIQFPWHHGLSTSQKKRNILELHQAALRAGLSPLLEISSKSELEIGQKLSAFNLRLDVAGRSTTVECAFQGSKVFEHGGPFMDLLSKTSREAKRDDRLKTSGRLIRFEFNGKHFPTTPPTVFYDWLYLNALYPHRDWLDRRAEWAGFTDIEFNPSRSLNCQARSFAMFISLQRRDLFEGALSSFESFRSLMQSTAL